MVSSYSFGQWKSHWDNMPLVLLFTVKILSLHTTSIGKNFVHVDATLTLGERRPLTWKQQTLHQYRQWIRKLFLTRAENTWNMQWTKGSSEIEQEAGWGTDLAHSLRVHSFLRGRTVHSQEMDDRSFSSVVFRDSSPWEVTVILRVLPSRVKHLWKHHHTHPKMCVS